MKHEKLPNLFAYRVKQLRKEKGLTQLELAQEVGLSKGTVAMWEVNKREASFSTLFKLASFFNTTIDYLLGYDLIQDLEVLE